MGSGPAAAVRQPALPAVHEPHPWEERRNACGHLGHDDTAVDGVEGVAHVDREDHAAQLFRRPLRLWVEQVEADSLRDRLARARDANANLRHLEQDVGDLWRTCSTGLGNRGLPRGCPWRTCSTALGRRWLPSAGRMLVGRWASDRLEVISSVERNDEGRENTPHAWGEGGAGGHAEKGRAVRAVVPNHKVGRAHAREEEVVGCAGDGRAQPHGVARDTHADPRRCKGRSRTPFASTEHFEEGPCIWKKK